MKYTIVGQILDSSGYAVHTRNLSNALVKNNDVKLQTGLNNNWLREVNDKELEAIKKQDSYDRIKIIVTHPVYWKSNCTNKRNFVYCVWEGDRVPKSFIKYMLDEDIEKILVPSEHTRQAILETIYNMKKEKMLTLFGFNPAVADDISSIISNKIVKIPHGVDHNIFKPIETKKDKFTFLMNKGFRNLQDRGGVQYGLKAYIEEFTNKDNVRLIIKVNSAYGVADFNKIIGDIAKDRKDIPEIAIDTGTYEYKDLVNLYNMSDVLLFTTRCEGFGLPALESMACGKPVITTKFGGQVDFVNEDNGFMIDYDLEEVKHEVQYENTKWATPKLDEIKRAMRECYNHPEYVKQKGELALEKSKEYSWDITAKLITDLK